MPFKDGETVNVINDPSASGPDAKVLLTVYMPTDKPAEYELLSRSQ